MTFSTTDVQVDEAAGVIAGASCMTIGPAAGHGFDIDAVTLEQLVSLINAEEIGLKSRFTHPKADEDGVEDVIWARGRSLVKNARLQGDSVRVDIHLADYAKAMPMLGRRDFCWPAKVRRRWGLSAVIFFEWPGPRRRRQPQIPSGPTERLQSRGHRRRSRGKPQRPAPRRRAIPGTSKKCDSPDWLPPGSPRQ